MNPACPPEQIRQPPEIPSAWHSGGPYQASCCHIHEYRLLFLSGPRYPKPLCRLHLSPEVLQRKKKKQKYSLSFRLFCRTAKPRRHARSLLSQEYQDALSLPSYTEARTYERLSPLRF